MPGDKRRNPKASGRSGAVAALGIAGALSLSGACSASASTGPTGNMRNTQVLLPEGEVSDVSLSTSLSSTKKCPSAALVCSLLLAMVAVATADAAVEAADVRRVDVDMAVEAEGVEAAAAGVAVAVAAAAVAVFGLDLSASANRRLRRMAGDASCNFKATFIVEETSFDTRRRSWN